MTEHLPGCIGGHPYNTCEYAMAIRAEWAADPWICHFSTSRGQPVHWMKDDSPDSMCQYEGCTTTNAQLGLS